MKKKEIKKERECWKMWLGLGLGAAIVGLAWLIWAMATPPKTVEVEKVVEKEVVTEVEVPTEEERQTYGRSYNPPEYFFTIKVYDIEYGKEQESGLLTFQDWIEIRVLNHAGNESYILHLADGSERRGTIGEDGTAREENVPPGRCSIEIERED